MLSGMDAGTVTILCAAVAGLVVNVLQYFREARTHRWAVEQSERDQAERLRVAEELKQEQRVAAEDVKRQHLGGVAILTDKIDKNTEISVAAFREANDVNNKIAAIGGLRTRGGQADRIEETVKDTNKVVHDLEQQS